MDGLEFTRLPSGEVTAHLSDEAATRALGERVARVLGPGLKIYLSGELGAGKTTLVRGLLRALGYGGRVKSPSFALVEAYDVSRLYLYHFDFYRFNHPREWRDAGFREEFGGAGVCLVEWPEKAEGLLPVADLVIELRHAGAGRTARLAGASGRGGTCLEQLIG